MKTLVIAPLPDDELLGCGGTLLRRGAEGGAVFPPFITGAISRAHQAAMATFCFGVMSPSAIFGRSLL